MLFPIMLFVTLATVQRVRLCSGSYYSTRTGSWRTKSRGAWPESQRSRRGTYWGENQGQDIFHVNKTYLLDYKLNAQTMQTLIFIAAVVCL